MNATKRPAMTEAQRQQRFLDRLARIQAEVDQNRRVYNLLTDGPRTKAITLTSGK